MDLVLERCSSGRDGPQFKPTLLVTAAAVPSAERYRISGDDLRSWWKKRELALTLYENGTIKSVGASTSDRMAAVISNLIKLGTAAASFGIRGPGLSAPETRPDVLHCSPTATQLTNELARLEREVATLQGDLARSRDPAAIVKKRAAIDALATRIAELRTGPLKTTLSTTISPPGRACSKAITWDQRLLQKWFLLDSDKAAQALALQAKFLPSSGDTAELPDCDAAPPSSPLAKVSDGVAPSGPYVVIREPVAATLAVAALPQQAGKWSLRGFDEAKAKVPLVIGQWGGKSYYSLKAGFGQTRGVKMELDAFGRKTGMTLNSEARAEAITGGLVGIGDSLVTYANATSDLKERETRIKELETQQKYNKIMLCEAIIEAGGFTCPP
jgi:hypothetical protein